MAVLVPFTPESERTLDWRGRLVPKLFVVSGKGGVGKTTVAAALAIARARSGRRTLCVSIDPAHSLGDSLDMNLADGEIHHVPGLDMLDALELRIQASPADGNVHDGDDIATMMGSVLFPVSEEMIVVNGLVNLFNQVIMNGQRYDDIIVDAAPSGHMIRALSYPFSMKDYVGRIVSLYDKIHATFELDARKRKLLKQQAAMRHSYTRIVETLQHPALATVLLVTIPEAMAAAETARTFLTLNSLGMNISNVVVNKIHDGGDDTTGCTFCMNRKAHEASILRELRESFKQVAMTEIPLLAGEVRGVEALVKFGRLVT